MSDFSDVPDYDNLKPVEGMPRGCVWGVFDKDGKKDMYGCVNFATPDVVKAAAAEVKDGVHISLNWPIGAIKTPGFGRKGLVHKVLSFSEGPYGLHGFDDEIEFNTQCSSQWDSLCHFAHQPSTKSYQGVIPTKEALTQDFGNHDTEKTLPTLNHWHERGGLVARGILLDYKAYADAKGIKYSPFEHHPISTDTLEDVAKHQGSTFKPGDVVIIHTGFTDELGGATAEEQEKMLGTHASAGVEGTEKAAKWFWNKRFSGAAGDAIAFEALPPPNKDGEMGKGSIAELVLHQYFLSLFGLNIGELWDLKALSAHCAKVKRYTFLLTSIPLHVPGGIGSPPNAIAIF